MTDSPSVLPYGSWPSPISAADVARGGIRLGFPALVPSSTGDDVWWVEGRPAEGGRQVIVSAARGDVLPAPWNARTRVHEYGGRCWLPVADGFVFTEWADQRVYRIDQLGAEPRPLTPAPPHASTLRYADPVLSPDGREAWWVRESHSNEGPDDEVTRAIVGVQ